MTTPCPENLLGLRRAGQLDAAQARLLDVHLQSCAACALDESLHESFEKDGRPQVTDDDLIARVVDSTLVQRRRLRGRRSWSLAIGLAAALVMVAGLASAAAWYYSRGMPRPAQPVSQMIAAPVARPVTPVPPAPIMPESELAPPEPAPVEQPRPPSVRTRPHRRPVVLGESPAAPAMDLKELFAAANEARRAGQLDHAGQLYAELQRRFPDSREALLSCVSYGRILLDRGRAAEALAQFERHIRGAPGGVLMADALYGQARALTSLHRETEARRCWADLLSRFPDSIYADVARSHLGAKP
jgi:TolA-binding protein